MKNKDRFKFRLWCKETKKYYQDEDVVMDLAGYLILLMIAKEAQTK